MPMKVFIIAEAGVNHNGSFQIALRLIEKAAECGADCVKFQTYITENAISRYAPKADYQIAATGNSTSQFDMVKKLQLSFDDFRMLKTHCENIGIQFLSTPFDLDSIAFLDTLHMPFWKIPSGEVTNLPYLLAIAKTEKPVVMSTGMCEIYEIQNAIDVLKANGTPSICLLQCNTEYPTPYSDVNLNAMLTMKEHFRVNIGYSDHTRGIEIPIAATALGATIIEKHFTLDCNMEGPDHQASLNPDAFARMVRGVRNVEAALGNGMKNVSSSEKNNIDVARKCIVAKTRIMKGELLTENNITTKRPGTGISPMKWFEVLGRTAVKTFEEDEMITL